MVKGNENKQMIVIIKMLAYVKGIFVPDELYEKLMHSSYSGYRTTSGVFFKIGASKSRKEFMNEHSKDLGDYLEYLKNREWVTAQIFKSSDFDENYASYLRLYVDDKGKFAIKGKYVNGDAEVLDLFCDDVGIFCQGNYDDSNSVAIQAGGIRARISICGSNCVSGCRFCSFCSSKNNYKVGTLTAEKLEEIKSSLRDVIDDQKITQIFITGGNPCLEDMELWTHFLKESIIEFKSYWANLGTNDTLTVDVMLTPRGKEKYVYDIAQRKQKYLEYCKELKKAGVDTVSPNIELWTQEKLEEYCPGKDGVSKSEIGQLGYLDFIDAAVEIFGPFKVRSALIIGLNDIEETKQAIDELIKRKCFVTLSPFKAPEEYQVDSRFAKQLYSKEPTINELIYLSLYLNDAIDKLFTGLNEEQKKLYRKNIQMSLNAHNSHNTANSVIGTFNDLDKLEYKAYVMGEDKTIVRNIKELEINNQNKHM